MKSFLSTKTTNRRQTSPEKRELLILFGLFLPAFLLLWLFPGLLGKVTAPLLTPFLSAETKIRQTLSNTDQQTGPVDEFELDRLREENNQLRTLMGDQDEQRIVAGVIGRPTNLPYDVLMIDRGEKDGIVKDAPVFVGKDQAIGFVISVYEKSAVIALVSTPGWRSTVYIYGPNIYTTAIGQGGGVTRVHTPQGIKLTEGDLVVVPSLNAGVYGRISAIDSVPSRAEQYGYVNMDTPLNSLRFVSVGTRPVSTVDFDTAKAIVEQTANTLLQINVPEGVLIEAGNSTSTATSTEEVATTTEETTASSTQ